jgi:uncharacterized protein (DUF1800 family)
VNDESGPWSPFEPTAGDRWDLEKVAHLHRRAGFGAIWSELQRDLAAGPQDSVDRILDPPDLPANERRLLDSLLHGALAGHDAERLKAWWLYRMLWGPDPLGEKLTLFWHGHFATSNRKVRSLPLMAEQNELFRRHARGSFAVMLSGIVADSAMLVWLDGGSSRREKPNENFARELLELFTLGPGQFGESDVREAARALTGWVPDLAGHRDGAQAFRFDRDRFDDGEKTFLGRRGPWNAEDIVEITLEQPAAAEFLCRKLYRFLASEAVDPPAELIGPLAAELRARGYSIRHVVRTIVRSRHFYSAEVRRQRIASPIEFSLGLLRVLEVPHRSVALLALAAACTAQGQDLFYPPSVKGWDGGRRWLNSATLLARGNWVNDVIWGHDRLGVPPLDVAGWAARYGLAPGAAVATLVELLLQQAIHPVARDTVVRAGADGRPDSLRKALQIALHCPEFQLT